MTVKTIKITRSHLKQIIKEELEAEVKFDSAILRIQDKVKKERPEFWDSIKSYIPFVDDQTESGDKVRIPPETVEMAGHLAVALITDPWILSELGEAGARRLYRRLLPGAALPARASSLPVVAAALKRTWAAATKKAPEIAKAMGRAGIGVITRGATRATGRVAARTAAKSAARAGASTFFKKLGLKALGTLAAGPLSPIIGLGEVFLLYDEFLSDTAKMYERKRDAIFFSMWRAHVKGDEGSPGRGLVSRRKLPFFDMDVAYNKDPVVHIANLKHIMCALQDLLADTSMWIKDEEGNYWFGGRGQWGGDDTISKAMRGNYIDLRKRLQRVSAKMRALLNATTNEEDKEIMRRILSPEVPCTEFKKV